MSVYLETKLVIVDDSDNTVATIEKREGENDRPFILKARAELYLTLDDLEQFAQGLMEVVIAERTKARTS